MGKKGSEGGSQAQLECRRDGQGYPLIHPHDTCSPLGIRTSEVPGFSEYGWTAHEVRFQPRQASIAPWEPLPVEMQKMREPISERFQDQIE